MPLKKEQTTTLEQTLPLNTEMFVLEQKKVKALEKIANSLDALTIWFEEIDKEEWSDRIQYYLSEWHTSIKKDEIDVDAKDETNIDANA